MLHVFYRSNFGYAYPKICYNFGYAHAFFLRKTRGCDFWIRAFGSVFDFGYVWICLDIFGYVWIRLSTFGYVWGQFFGYAQILDTFGYAPTVLDTFLIFLDTIWTCLASCEDTNY